jgi:hypothetical protein
MVIAEALIPVTNTLLGLDSTPLRYDCVLGLVAGVMAVTPPAR